MFYHTPPPAKLFGEKLDNTFFQHCPGNIIDSLHHLKGSTTEAIEVVDEIRICTDFIRTTSQARDEHVWLRINGSTDLRSGSCTMFKLYIIVQEVLPRSPILLDLNGRGHSLSVSCGPFVISPAD